MTIEDELSNGFEHATRLLGSLIYILALDDTVLYVGRSNNFLVRLFKHRAAGKINFNRVYVKSVLRDLASAEEARLIRELKPIHNIASTSKAKRMTKAEITAQARLPGRELRRASWIADFEEEKMRSPQSPGTSTYLDHIEGSPGGRYAEAQRISGTSCRMRPHV